MVSIHIPELLVCGAFLIVLAVAFVVVRAMLRGSRRR